MEQMDFEKMKETFRMANTDTQIDMYATTEGLTQEQYKELLRMFPMDALDKLEEALR